MIHDTIDGVLIDTDEDGFELTLSGLHGEWRFNIQAVALELDAAVKREIGPWILERMRAAREFRCDPDESGGYADNDPKSPTFHERMSDAADLR